MRHICQTMHIEISCVVATQRRKERERERERERMVRRSTACPPAPLRALFLQNLTPFRPVASTSPGPRLRAYLCLCKTRIRSDDDSLASAALRCRQAHRERVRRREKEREKERAGCKNSANRRWQIYRACFIGAICTHNGTREDYSARVEKWVAERRRSERKHGDPPLARPLSYNLRVYVDARHVHKRPMADPAVRQNDRINSRDSTEFIFSFSPLPFFYFFFYIL